MAISRIYLSWARGGLRGMREAGRTNSHWQLARHLCDPRQSAWNPVFFSGCLAELEAAAGDHERALALFDQRRFGDGS